MALRPSAPVPSTSNGSSHSVEAKPEAKTESKPAANRPASPVPGTSSKSSAPVQQAPMVKPGSAAPAAKPVAGGAPSSKYPANIVGPDGVKPTKEKLQALGQAVSQIEKAFGKGSIMKLDENAYLNIPGISTGSISLDLALGGKGIPRGRIVEIFGPESSGKTTLALTVASHAQRNGGVAAFIDAEHALDPSWARKIGVNIDDLLVSQPDSGEQALEICELLVRSNAVDLIIIDSVAALIPKAEIEGDMGEAVVGLQARLMSQAMRKLTGIIARSSCTVIFINQIREKIGVMYGSPETTPGGRALKFYASVRIDIRRTSSLKEADIAIGNRVRARVVKNKVAPPFREAEFDIMFDEGISAAGDLIDLAVDTKVVDKSGAWFSYGDIRIGQGRETAKKFLKDNRELFDEVRRKVLTARATTAPTVKIVVDEEDEESED